MNEKDVMNLLNSIDDDLVDKKIDDLLDEMGESINLSSIKEKAINKIKPKQAPKYKINKKAVIAAAVAATFTLSTVYAGEISKAIQSFYNKSMVYSTIVDGDAYYLPQEVKLNDKFTLLYVSVSKGHLDMTVKSNGKLSDKETEDLNVSIIPISDKHIRYSVGGYGYDQNGAVDFSFMNETENNYNITPFKDFKFTIDGSSYDISLVKAGGLETDENLVIGTSESDTVISDDNLNEITASKTRIMPLIANVGGSANTKDGLINIQLAAGFDDSDLKLRALGEPDFTEYSHTFTNNKGGIISSSTGSMTKPIVAYDKDNNAYTLNKQKGAVGRPITVFETDAKQGTELTVKLPAICVGFEKEVATMSLEIPKEGESIINKELDFIVQKATAKSIKRISKDTAVVEFELNIGDDKTVSIMDIGAYSKDVIKSNTIINGNIATMTITFDENIEKADFKFSWPYYVIQGNWSIELGAVK